MSASVNLPLHHTVEKFSSGTSSPGWSRKKGRKMVVVQPVCVCFFQLTSLFIIAVSISTINLPQSVRLGRAYDRGIASPLVLQGHVICCSGC